MKTELEEASEKSYPLGDGFQILDIDISEMLQLAFINGAEWQQERSYNEEELRKIVKYAFNAGQRAESGKISKDITLNSYLNSLKRNNGKKNKYTRRRCSDIF